MLVTPTFTTVQLIYFTTFFEIIAVVLQGVWLLFTIYFLLQLIVAFYVLRTSALWEFFIWVESILVMVRCSSFLVSSFLRNTKIEALGCFF